MNDIGEASYEERGLRSTGDDTEISSEPKNMSCVGVAVPSTARAWQARYICMGAITQARSMEGIRWSKGKCAGSGGCW